MTRRSPPGPGAGRSSREHSLDGGGRGAIADSGLVAGAGQCLNGKLGGDVHQRAGHRCHRNAAEARPVMSIEGTAAMDPDPLNASLGRRGHLGRRKAALHEAMQVRGRQTTQDRAFARSNDGSEVGGFRGWCPVSDSVDPSVLAQEAAAPQAPLDLLRTHPRFEELRSRHHPMRAGRHSCQLLFNRPA